MPEPVPLVLNLREMREQVLRSRAEVASEIGVSPQLLTKIEFGQVDTRLLVIFQLCLVLARYLETLPSQVFGDLFPPQAYENFEEVHQRARVALASVDTQKGNYRAKRRFLRRSEATSEGESPLEAVSLYRFQLLFAMSHYSQVDLSKVTDISERRLNQIFAISAPGTGHITLRIFLRLAAALAPVYKAGLKETALYLVGGDLEKLDASYEAWRQNSGDNQERS